LTPDDWGRPDGRVPRGSCSIKKSVKSLASDVIDQWHRFFLGPHLFVKVPRPGDSEVTFSVFETYLEVFK